jgi:hypothetical protein
MISHSEVFGGCAHDHASLTARRWQVMADSVSIGRFTRGTVRYGNDQAGVVRMDRAMVWSIAFMASLLASSHVQAQQNNQAKRGLSLAKFACAKCHSVERGCVARPMPPRHASKTSQIHQA